MRAGHTNNSRQTAVRATAHSAVQYAEKVFDFQHSIFGQVGAVDGVLYLVLSEHRPQRFWSEVAGNFLGEKNGRIKIGRRSETLCSN